MFFSKIIDSQHYILTSCTTKHRNNGHRLIMIVHNDGENYLFPDYMTIRFENILIKITPTNKVKLVNIILLVRYQFNAS